MRTGPLACTKTQSVGVRSPVPPREGLQCLPRLAAQVAPKTLLQIHQKTRILFYCQFASTVSGLFLRGICTTNLHGLAFHTIKIRSPARRDPWRSAQGHANTAKAAQPPAPAQHQLDSRVRRSGVLAHQSKTGRSPVATGFRRRPGLPTGPELVLPPVELTLFQPTLPTKLPNRCPALRRLTDCPLPITCLLRVTLSALTHPTPPRLIHTCALDACPGDYLSGKYQAGTSIAVDGFTGRIRSNWRSVKPPDPSCH